MTQNRVVTEIRGQMPGYNFVLSPEMLIHKHTGYKIDRGILEGTEMGRECIRAAVELTNVEYLLHQARNELLRLAEKIRLNIESGPGEQVEAFFPQGEVNGSKIGQIDSLLTDRRNHIRTVVSKVNLLLHLDGGRAAA